MLTLFRYTYYSLPENEKCIYTCLLVACMYSAYMSCTHYLVLSTEVSTTFSQCLTSLSHTVLQSTSKLTPLSMCSVSSPPSVIMSLHMLPCHTPEFIIPTFSTGSTCCNVYIALTYFFCLCNSTCTVYSCSDPIAPSCVQVSLRPCCSGAPMCEEIFCKIEWILIHAAFYYLCIYIKGSVDELACTSVCSHKRLRYDLVVRV